MGNPTYFCLETVGIITRYSVEKISSYSGHEETPKTGQKIPQNDLK